MDDSKLEKYYKLSVATLLVALFLFLASPLSATGSASLGGTFVNSDSATATGSFNYQWEQDNWQQTFESDYQFKEEDNKETMNELFLNTKANYTFAPKHYVFGVAQYDYDKFRADGDRKV
jgi:hypothetical protein